MRFRKTVAVLIILATALSAQSPVKFVRSDFGIFYAPTRVAVGNVTGSPRPEIIVVLEATQSLLVIDLDVSLAGTLVPLPGDPTRAALADLDQDGDLDIVVMEDLPPASVAVLINTNGAFAIASYAVPFSSRLYLTDMNGDGATDIVCGRTILTNSGTGTFVTGAAPVGLTGINEMVPGDFDGDGDQDLVLAFQGSSPAGAGFVMRFFRQDASQVFTLLPTVLLRAGASSGKIEVADVNGDGRSDVVAASYVIPSTPPTNAIMEVRAFFGGAGMTATPGTPIDFFGAAIGEFRLADVTGDGLPDVSGALGGSANGNFTQMHTLVNDGQGAFLPPTGPNWRLMNFNLSGTEIAAGDIDLDGDTDFAMLPPGSGAQTITVAENRSNQIGAGDLPTIGGVAPKVYPTNTNVLLGVPATPNQLVLPTLIPGTTTPAGFRAGVMSLSTATPSTALIPFRTGTPGTFSIDASLSDGQTTTIGITVVTPMHVVIGDQQTTAAGAAFPVTLRARLIASSGAAISGRAVTWTSTGTNPVTLVNATTATNIFGDCSATAIAGPGSGPAAVTVADNQGNQTTFSLTIVPLSQVAAIDGHRQGTGIDRDFLHPVTIEVTDPQGQPVAGLAVAYTTAGAPVILSAANAVTDAAGRATITVKDGLFDGPIQIDATTALGRASFELASRKLIGSYLGTTITLEYRHEHGACPLIVSGDLPLPTPGYVGTPIGDLYTSLIAPTPTLYIADGIGFFSAPLPDLKTDANGRYLKFITIPASPVPYGVTAVFQILAYDEAYGFPETFTLSNPVFVNL